MTDGIVGNFLNKKISSEVMLKSCRSEWPKPWESPTLEAKVRRSPARPKSSPIDFLPRYRGDDIYSRSWSRLAEVWSIGLKQIMAYLIRYWWMSEPQSLRFISLVLVPILVTTSHNLHPKSSLCAGASWCAEVESGIDFAQPNMKMYDQNWISLVTVAGFV